MLEEPVAVRVDSLHVDAAPFLSPLDVAVIDAVLIEKKNAGGKAAYFLKNKKVTWIEYPKLKLAPCACLAATSSLSLARLPSSSRS